MSEIPSQIEDMVQESTSMMEACVAPRMPDGFYVVTVRDHVNTDLFRTIQEADGVEYFSIRAPYPAEEKAFRKKILKLMVTVEK